MNTRAMYHEGSRQLQDRFDSRRLADRLEQVTVHAAFDDDDRTFIGKAAQFFLATADAEGRPDCSYKGGMPGFVRILDASTLAFPDYDAWSSKSIPLMPRARITRRRFRAGRRIRHSRTRCLAAMGAADGLAGEWR